MEPEIRQVFEITDTLLEACGRLLPQLAPGLAAPGAARLERLLGSGSAALFAAWIGERIVGMLTVVWYDVPSGRKAWIEDVVVEAEMRGCGVGEALVRAGVGYAARLGVQRVSLTSNPARTAARALYRKMGFEEAETAVFVRKTDTE